MAIALVVNRRRRTVTADPGTPLLWVLRDVLGLTRTKYGCGVGVCGACTVLSDGKAVRSCQIALKDAAGKSFVTIEGLSPDASHPCQVAWIEEVPTDRPRDRLLFVVHRVVCALDCGVIINPLGIAQQIESGVVWGLSNMKGEVTFRDGRAEQSTYQDFAVLRMSETPVVETHLVSSHGEQPFGIGEPVVPPLAPAVANALHAATDQRVRRLPVRLPTRST